MFRRSRPSAALVVAIIALIVALGGVSAAATGLINGASIKPGTIGHRQLGKHSVSAVNLARNAVGTTNLTRSLRLQLNRRTRVTLPGQSGTPGSGGSQGGQGAQGGKGDQGATGQPGANPGEPVVNVPTIAASSGKNPNPDSGDAGDQGFYFSGKGPGGSAQITNGELELSGVGTDSATAQGGIGIAKAFNKVPLANLNALSYDWHVNQLKGSEAPTIHVTVTGLNSDSKFGPGCAKPPCSGFANLVYAPGLNGVVPTVGAAFQSDTFAPGSNLWYSTTEPSGNPVGGQNSPQPLLYFMGRNSGAVITQISLDNGGSSGANGSFDAGADNLILGFAGSPFTRYDFGG